MKGSVILAALAGVLAGAAGGWIVRGQRPAIAAPASAPERLVVAPACTGATPAQVRAIVEETLAARGNAAPGPAAAETETAPPAPPEPLATRAVDEGIADGIWSDDDRIALHGAMSRTTAADAHDAMSHLAVAINEGRVRVATSGPPF